MKHLPNIFLKLLTCLSLLLLNSTLLMAGPPPPATPIDGGISALLVAGGVYGLQKIRKYTK